MNKYRVLTNRAGFLPYPWDLFIQAVDDVDAFRQALAMKKPDVREWPEKLYGPDGNMICKFVD